MKRGPAVRLGGIAPKARTTPKATARPTHTLAIAKREKVFSGRKNALETLFPSSPPSPRTSIRRRDGSAAAPILPTHLIRLFPGSSASVLEAFVSRRLFSEGVGVRFGPNMDAQRGIFRGRSPKNAILCRAGELGLSLGLGDPSPGNEISYPVRKRTAGKAVHCFLVLGRRIELLLRD